MKKAVLLSAAALSLTISAPAYADIQFFDSPGAIQPPENVLLPSGQTGTTIGGNTNQTNTLVTFQSLSCSNNNSPPTCTTVGAEDLTTPANGQARIEAVDKSLDAIKFFLTGGQSFLEFEFNLNKTIDALQTIVLTVREPDNSFSTHTYALNGNGQNYFAGRAVNGQSIQSVEFNASGLGAEDLRQVRLGGIGQTSPLVPEPSTWAMMLIGFAGVGLMLRRRRQQSYGGWNSQALPQLA